MGKNFSHANFQEEGGKDERTQNTLTCRCADCQCGVGRWMMVWSAGVDMRTSIVSVFVKNSLDSERQDNLIYFAFKESF